ncbi:hypothetical protein NHX12_034423 [Muraenolepis orangiensis]|uniref:Cilia- and flagella-associated protein 299 n=1 Tax=Muraenolepis orangiensis TaxID=630683 RepID=A0A9Q0D8I0_9TELE|nr:hypothetical protein NHX12_034423 [Muraenolepis orangiensis]
MLAKVHLFDSASQCGHGSEAVRRSSQELRRSIVFLRDRDAGGHHISSFIDLAQRLQSDDFEAYFSGKKRLAPRCSDLR